MTVVPEDAIRYSKSIRGDDISVPLSRGRFAHLIIDMQNAFVAPGGVAELPHARLITPNINLVSRAMRAAGAPNVFIRETYDPGWTSFWGRLVPDEKRAAQQALSYGASQHALWPELEVAEDDLVVDKLRFSPFVAGSSDLDHVLRRRGIDTVVVTGCMTNCCCESTLRDAVQLNYGTIFLHDANAAKNDADHNATVANLVGVLGCEVCSTADFTRRLETLAQADAA